MRFSTFLVLISVQILIVSHMQSARADEAPTQLAQSEEQTPKATPEAEETEEEEEPDCD